MKYILLFLGLAILAVSFTSDARMGVDLELDLGSGFDVPWTPAVPTSDGGVLPEHWYSSQYGFEGFSDTDAVATWPDRASNGDDLTQSTAGYRPTFQTDELNGEPVIRFDGSDDYLDGAFTNGGSVSAPRTVFLISKMVSGANDDDWHNFIDGLTADDRNTIYQWVTPTPDEFSFYAGSNASTFDIETDGDWHIFVVIPNGASSVMYLDGGTEITGNPGSDSLDGLTVGARHDGANNANIDVVDIVIYPGVLSDADLNEIGGTWAEGVYDLSWTDIE